MELQQRTFPAPPRTPDSQRFWDAAGERRLLFKRCEACGKPHYYPRNLCPFCFSDATTWMQASGRGTIYSFTVMRRADPVYVMAFVTLEEGVSMMTNIVCTSSVELKIGQAVWLTWRTAEDGTPIPVFAPVDEDGAPVHEAPPSAGEHHDQ